MQGYLTNCGECVRILSMNDLYIILSTNGTPVSPTIVGPFPDLKAIQGHLDLMAQVGNDADVVGIFPNTSQILGEARVYAKSILTPAEAAIANEETLLGGH